uniref:ANK_REP_REGION domain-containing protein n=1 Tax=Caenorhabditis tropicalis TaxID=1561998 RepID=A0A1I7TEM1_9PELO
MHGQEHPGVIDSYKMEPRKVNELSRQLGPDYEETKRYMTSSEHWSKRQNQHENREDSSSTLVVDGRVEISMETNSSNPTHPDVVKVSAKEPEEATSSTETCDMSKNKDSRLALCEVRKTNNFCDDELEPDMFDLQSEQISEMLRKISPEDITNDHMTKCYENGYQIFHWYHIVSEERDNGEGKSTCEVNPHGGTVVEDADLTNADHTSRSSCLNDIDKIFSITDDPVSSYVTFLEESADILRRLAESHDTYQDTIKLDPKDAKEHWSKERLTRCEHDRRFTRWDAAMATAVKGQTNDEIYLINRNGYTFEEGISKSKFCSERALKIERIVNESSSTTKFYYQQFSLLDIAERKATNGLRANDAAIFTQALAALRNETSKKGGFEKNLKNYKQMTAIGKALTKQGIRTDVVLKELAMMLEDDYLLPKGKLFCRLVLNIAELYFYTVIDHQWNFRRNTEWNDQTLFKGIPFNEEGNPFQFE